MMQVRSAFCHRNQNESERIKRTEHHADGGIGFDLTICRNKTDQQRGDNAKHRSPNHDVDTQHISNGNARKHRMGNCIPHQRHAAQNNEATNQTGHDPYHDGSN